MKKFIQKLESYQPEHLAPECISQRDEWKQRLGEYKLTGKPVLYYKEDRYIKNRQPTLAYVSQLYEFHVVLQYKCYNAYGDFRSFQSISVMYSSLISGEEKLCFFGDI